MTTFTLTQQDKSLITLCTGAEAKSYNTVYGGREIQLDQMTIAEVMQWQRDARAAGARGTAVGKYQMIPDTLLEETQKAKLDPLTTRFTKDTQDYLMLGRLKRFRRYEQFKEKSLGASELENAQSFCLRLAQEFASIPVPYATRGDKRAVAKGESYYAGDGLNKSHHDPDSFVNGLMDIRRGGPGATIASFETGRTVAGSNATNPQGETPRQQMRNFAAGGGTRPAERAGTSTAAMAQARQRNGLPPADNVYTYELIDPLDDRYDFRTGKKVTDITLLGTQSVAAYNQANSATAQSTPASQLGVAPLESLPDLENYTVDDVVRILNNRDSLATAPGRYSDSIADPYDPTALLTVPGRNPVIPQPGSTPNTARGSSGLTGEAQPSQQLPRPGTPVPVTSSPTAVAGTGIGPNGESITGVTPQTDLRTAAIELQKKYDIHRKNIQKLITDSIAVLNSQPAKYGETLRSDLTAAQNELRAARELGDSTLIFRAETQIASIQAKLNLGSPYGLTAAAKEQLARSDTEYQTIITRINTEVVSAETVVEQARRQGIDLAQPNIVSNTSSVPPRVVFE